MATHRKLRPSVKFCAGLDRVALISTLPAARARLRAGAAPGGGIIGSAAAAVSALDAGWRAAAEMSNTGDWLRPFFGLSGLVGMTALLVLFALHDRFVAEQSLMRADG